MIQRKPTGAAAGKPAAAAPAHRDRPATERRSADAPRSASPAPGAGTATSPARIIVAITGATGVVYGVRLLELLRQQSPTETHLLVSAAGWLTIEQELDRSKASIEALADQVHNVRDVGASIASGSFPTQGMVVAPCSMRSLAAIAHGLSDNLITRAADVTLKERRRLVLLARETPLNLAHLRNMTLVTEMGGIVFPPLPSFYHHPTSLGQMIDHTCARVFDLLGIPQHFGPSWQGREKGGGNAA